MNLPDDVKEVVKQLDAMERGRHGRLPPLMDLPHLKVLMGYMESGGELPRNVLEAICWWCNFGATEWENWTTEAILDFLKVETDQLEREYKEGNKARELALQEGYPPEAAQETSDKVREKVRDKYMHDGEDMDFHRQYEYARRRLHEDPDFMPLIEPIGVLPCKDVIRVSRDKFTSYGSKWHESMYKRKPLKRPPTIHMIYDVKSKSGMVSLDRIQITHEEEG